MLLPLPADALAIASRFTVLNQRTMKFEQFNPNADQCALIEQDCENDRSAAGKGRQIGASTIRVWLLFLIALMNPGLPMAIFADEQKNAEKLLAKVVHWCAEAVEQGEAGARLVKSDTRTIVFANGASIEARTAISRSSTTGQSRAGRSSSYAVVYSTEVAFWENAAATWAAIMSTSPLLVLVDSTGAPGEGLFRGIIEQAGGDNDDERWAVKFFGVESHEEYRADPNSITDERWAELRDAYKFTQRDSAAWWHRKLFRDFHGDVFAMLREFPVIQPHMFMFAAGQHIKDWIVAKIRRFGAWYNSREKREDFEWDVYVEDPDEPVAIGVDTATGHSLDASALAIVGQRTGRTVRTYRRNNILIPDFIDVIKKTIDEWKPVATVVESNGVGAGVFSEIRRYQGANAVEHWSSGRANKNDSELHLRRAEIKGEIESGEVPIAGHLLHEAQNSVVSARATFEGPDDTLSALSFVRRWVKKNPYVAPPEPVDMRVTYVAPPARGQRHRY